MERYIKASKLQKVVKYDADYHENLAPGIAFFLVVMSFSFWRGYEQDFMSLLVMALGAAIIWFGGWWFSRHVYYRRIK